VSAPTHAGNRPRYVIIGGAGRVAASHLEVLAELPVHLVGLADIDGERGAQRAHDHGCAFFLDSRAMLAELRPDAAVICTPPPSHASLAIDCFRVGAHALIEKPIADDVASAEGAIVAAESAGRWIGVNFPERFRPAVEYARGVLARGELGPITRVLSIEPWLRTAAYYRSAPWRATWKGEGGGVLLNQAPHMLDVLCHLLGLPARVWGMTRTRVHAVECEDSAQAMLEYQGGAFGYVAASTVEAGTDKMLEIVGDRAVMKIAVDKVHITRLDRSLCEHASQAANGSPSTSTEIVEFDSPAPGLPAVHRDFLAALREGRPPRCDGKSALMSLELANAIILSSFRERSIALPLDRAEYAGLLANLRAGLR
jgi:UDP-N-acetyl-2-amino-2-deoxyglucuronate dehydrogenase